MLKIITLYILCVQHNSKAQIMCVREAPCDVNVVIRGYTHRLCAEVRVSPIFCGRTIHTPTSGSLAIYGAYVERVLQADIIII